MTTGTEAARAATRRDDLRRRLRGTSGRARKLRGLIVLLAPYRSRVVLMFVALVAGTGLVMVISFTVVTLVTVFMLQSTPWALNWREIAQGRGGRGPEARGALLQALRLERQDAR